MTEEILRLLEVSYRLIQAVDELRAGKGQPASFSNDERRDLLRMIAKLERRIGEEAKIADGKS